MATIGIVAYGSRGDVQPMAALAKGLEKAGHRAKLLVNINFKSWIEELGLEAVAYNLDTYQLHHTDLAYRLWEIGDRPAELTQLAAEWGDAMGHGHERAIYPFARDVDLLVSGQSYPHCAAVAEKLRIPCLFAFFSPSAKAERGADGKTRLKHFSMPGGVDELNGFRCEFLGLEAQTESQLYEVFVRTTSMHAYSRHVGVHLSDWPDNFHTIGYCFLDRAVSWTPPNDLAAFVEKGEPPVVIGFGSMTARDASEVTKVVAGAVEDSGQRAILLAGWTGLGQADELPPNVFCAGDVPHEWLLPRATAVVNHGGCGSVAAGLRAGLPTVVVPFSFDQFFWGRRVAQLGVGPDPITRNTLDRQSLAAAIEKAVSSKDMRQRAREMSDLIAEEDGVGRGVELVETHL